MPWQWQKPSHQAYTINVRSLFWCWTQVISVLRKVVKGNILLSYNTIRYASVLLWGSCYFNHWSTTRYHECPSFYPPTLLVGEVLSYRSSGIALQWRHNKPDSVSNHQSPDCLLNHLFRCRSKKTSKLRVTGLCEGNPPVTSEFPTERAINAENLSIWWRHHVSRSCAMSWSAHWLHMGLLAHGSETCPMWYHATNYQYRILNSMSKSRLFEIYDAIVRCIILTKSANLLRVWV